MLVENIEVYNIICDSLGIDPKPNNGTLRLPLRTIGFHSPETAEEEPHDPPSSPSLSHPPVSSGSVLPPPSPASSPEEEADAVISISPIEASSAANPNVVPPVVVGVDAPEENGVTRPVVEDTGTGETEEEKDFVKWMKEKLDKLKGWLGNVFGGDKDKEKDEGSTRRMLDGRGG